LYGILTENTGGHVGTWVIGGKTFVSTAATRFEGGHGNESFGIGQCIKVEYTVANNVNTATSIEREEGYRCNNGTQTNSGYGIVETLPANRIGTWSIQTTGRTTMTLEISTTTRIEEQHSALSVGSCIKLVYHSNQGSLYADSIKTRNNNNCRSIKQDDGPRVPALPGDNKVYATLEQFPEPPYIGAWIIGSTTYSATEQTRFEQEGGLPFVEGACVKARYLMKGDNRMLIKVETEDAYHCGSKTSTTSKSYGVVERIPNTATYTGTWQIGGMPYEATEATRMEQEHGFFAIGAYVEVVYTISDGTRTASSIETHVAPNAGAYNKTGTFTGRTTQGEWEVWTIDGAQYRCDPAMEVEQPATQTATTLAATPDVGQQVAVNYYEHSDGYNYLTYATFQNSNDTKAPAANTLFLPHVLR